MCGDCRRDKRAFTYLLQEVSKGSIMRKGLKFVQKDERGIASHFRARWYEPTHRGRCMKK